MGAINRTGFKATVAGANKRVKVHAEFLGTVMDVDASLEFARLVVKWAPMISMGVPSSEGKAGIADAKREIEAAIKAAGG